MTDAQRIGGIALLATVSVGALAGLGITFFGTARKRRVIRERLADITVDTIEMLNERSKGLLRSTFGLPKKKGIKKLFYSATADAARALTGTGRSRWRLHAW